MNTEPGTGVGWLELTTSECFDLLAGQHAGRVAVDDYGVWRDCCLSGDISWRSAVLDYAEEVLTVTGVSSENGRMAA